MAISLRNKGVEELARSLAYERGESITEAIGEALVARLHQLGPQKRYERDYAIISAAAARIAALPGLSDAPADEILGYDQNGLPS